MPRARRHFLAGYVPESIDSRSKLRFNVKDRLSIVSSRSKVPAVPVFDTVSMSGTNRYAPFKTLLILRPVPTFHRYAPFKSFQSLAGSKNGNL